MIDNAHNKILSRIYGKGRGWAFSPKDFADLGSTEAVHVSLHRLTRQKTIRRVAQGIYDYPAFSKLLDQQLSPDIDRVAQSLARKFGWKIYPSGEAALGILGLSTQVPAQFLYLSDGPNRSCRVGKQSLQFKHVSQKEIAFKHPESALIVQALKALGEPRVDGAVIETIQQWLDPAMDRKVLRDTRMATRWIYNAIERICDRD